MKSRSHLMTRSKQELKKQLLMGFKKKDRTYCSQLEAFQPKDYGTVSDGSQFDPGRNRDRTSFSQKTPKNHDITIIQRYTQTKIYQQLNSNHKQQPIQPEMKKNQKISLINYQSQKILQETQLQTNNFFNPNFQTTMNKAKAKDYGSKSNNKSILDQFSRCPIREDETGGEVLQDFMFVRNRSHSKSRAKLNTSKNIEISISPYRQRSVQPQPLKKSISIQTQILPKPIPNQQNTSPNTRIGADPQVNPIPKTPTRFDDRLLQKSEVFQYSANNNINKVNINVDGIHKVKNDSVVKKGKDNQLKSQEKSLIDISSNFQNYQYPSGHKNKILTDSILQAQAPKLVQSQYENNSDSAQELLRQLQSRKTESDKNKNKNNGKNKQLEAQFDINLLDDAEESLELDKQHRKQQQPTSMEKQTKRQPKGSNKSIQIKTINISTKNLNKPLNSKRLNQKNQQQKNQDEDQKIQRLLSKKQNILSNLILKKNNQNQSQAVKSQQQNAQGSTGKWQKVKPKKYTSFEEVLQQQKQKIKQKPYKQKSKQRQLDPLDLLPPYETSSSLIGLEAVIEQQNESELEQSTYIKKPPSGFPLIQNLKKNSSKQNSKSQSKNSSRNGSKSQSKSQGEIQGEMGKLGKKSSGENPDRVENVNNIDNLSKLTNFQQGSYQNLFKSDGSIGTGNNSNKNTTIKDHNTKFKDILFSNYIHNNIEDKKVPTDFVPTSNKGEQIKGIKITSNNLQVEKDKQEDKSFQEEQRRMMEEVQRDWSREQKQKSKRQWDLPQKRQRQIQQQIQRQLRQDKNPRKQINSNQSGSSHGKSLKSVSLADLSLQDISSIDSVSGKKQLPDSLRKIPALPDSLNKNANDEQSREDKQEEIGESVYGDGFARNLYNSSLTNFRQPKPNLNLGARTDGIDKQILNKDISSEQLPDYDDNDDSYANINHESQKKIQQNRQKQNKQRKDKIEMSKYIVSDIANDINNLKKRISLDADIQQMQQKQKRQDNNRKKQALLQQNEPQVDQRKIPGPQKSPNSSNPLSAFNSGNGGGGISSKNYSSVGAKSSSKNHSSSGAPSSKVGSSGVDKKVTSMLDFFDEVHDKINFSDISKDIIELRDRMANQVD